MQGAAPLLYCNARARGYLHEGDDPSPKGDTPLRLKTSGFQAFPHRRFSRWYVFSQRATPVSLLFVDGRCHSTDSGPEPRYFGTLIGLPERGEAKECAAFSCSPLACALYSAVAVVGGLRGSVFTASPSLANPYAIQFSRYYGYILREGAQSGNARETRPCARDASPLPLQWRGVLRAKASFCQAYIHLAISAS